MLAQVLVSSVTAGAVYALIALGFVLIHKGTGVVHFGYGDQVMFGAYLVLIGQVVLGLPFWPAVVSALMLSALLGAVIYGGFMWPLRNASLLARIIASLALGTVLREFVRAYMGPNAWPFPFLLSQTAVSVADVLVVPPPVLAMATTPTKAIAARKMPTRIRIRFDRFTTSLPGICDRCQHSGLRSTEPRLYQWATPPRKDSPNRRQSRTSPEPTPTYFRELMSIPTPGRGQTLPG